MFRFRDEPMARKILDRLDGLDVELQLMHVCGTHQDTLVRFGLEGPLKEVGISIRQGPGCPVCVTTSREIVEAMEIADSGVTLAVFGDMLDVPTPEGSLSDIRASGADVRVVYSIEDAVDLAAKKEEVVFLAIGFETTVPTTAATMLRDLPDNFYIYSCHRLIPPALQKIFDLGEVKVDGFIQPGHVATIIGLDPFRPFSDRYSVPQVVVGFEPLDLLMGAYMLARQKKEGRSEVENEYRRVVKEEGNPVALETIEKVFVPSDIPWRGFPMIEDSVLELKAEYEDHDAKVVYRDLLEDVGAVEEETEGCLCGEVLRGLIDSRECPAFGRSCTPRSPMGPCMVSREGSCNITYRYGRG